MNSRIKYIIPAIASIAAGAVLAKFFIKKATGVHCATMCPRCGHIHEAYFKCPKCGHVHNSKCINTCKG